ncbi:MAG: hypothetical protein ACOYIA_05465 [Eubacteriales bacterium]|jgi:hypothetical protein
METTNCTTVPTKRKLNKNCSNNIKVEHIQPNLSAEKLLERKKKIESELYKVLKKTAAENRGFSNEKADQNYTLLAYCKKKGFRF